MAEKNSGAPESNGEQLPPRVHIMNQYIRDLSFENVAVQKGIMPEGKTAFEVQVNLDARKVGDDQYEVVNKLKVEAKIEDAKIFILELDYAGRFVIQNVPEEQLHPFLMVECPRLLFPFLRRVVSDVTRDGGYPPLNLDTIDFVALYRGELARRAQEQAAGQPVS